MNSKKKSFLRKLAIIIAFGLNLNIMYAQSADSFDYSKVITAIGTVESHMNDNARGGIHAGFLQISPILVKECNNILKEKGETKRYTNNDRFNHQKSIEMFYLIQNKYNPSHNIEAAIRLWNGGPGWKKNPSRTNRYYQKVKKILEKL